MNFFLFKDIFTNIQYFLSPIDLYRLSQTCQRCNKIITKNDIDTSIISEINRRLNVIFGRNYIEFMKTLRSVNGVLVGSFIAQCILGETWEDDDVCIHVENPAKMFAASLERQQNFGLEENGDEILKFLIDKDYLTASICRDSYLPWDHHNRVKFQVRETFFTLKSLQNKLSPISTKDYILDRYDRNYAKNFYNPRSGELYVHRIDEIFAKYTNLYFKGYIATPESFSKMCNRRFRFYKSDVDKKMMSVNDAYCLVYKPIWIKGMKSKNACEKYLSNHGFKIDNNVIYAEKFLSNGRISQPLFYIDTTSIGNENIIDATNMSIDKCDPQIDCITRSLYPETNHYHGRYFEDYIYKIPVIFIPSYE
uniref:F-box domain-containing protein n=1 Tax=viral metagenome TaxID=1070528 RepID=A0A6C0CC97_9ZZZZ